MDIRERLEAELRRCRSDVADIHDQAPLIAARYIARRLDQLDRRFRRHAWGWSPGTIYSVGLRVIPHVWSEHDAREVVRMAMRRSMKGDGLEGIERVAGDIDTLGRRIALEFGRPVPPVLSSRAREWGVVLAQLSPNTIANRARRAGTAAVGLSENTLARATGANRVGTMNRSGGRGYF